MTRCTYCNTWYHDEIEGTKHIHFIPMIDTCSLCGIDFEATTDGYAAHQHGSLIHDDHTRLGLMSWYTPTWLEQANAGPLPLRVDMREYPYS